VGSKDVGMEECVTAGKFSALFYDFMCDGKKLKERFRLSYEVLIKFLDVIKFREVISLCFGNPMKKHKYMLWAECRAF
jgi:hypothetical protein